MRKRYRNNNRDNRVNRVKPVKSATAEPVLICLAAVQPKPKPMAFTIREIPDQVRMRSSAASATAGRDCVQRPPASADGKP
jgi:hypothetical protein